MRNHILQKQLSAYCLLFLVVGLSFVSEAIAQNVHNGQVNAGGEQLEVTVICDKDGKPDLVIVKSSQDGAKPGVHKDGDDKTDNDGEDNGQLTCEKKGVHDKKYKEKGLFVYEEDGHIWVAPYRIKRTAPGQPPATPEILPPTLLPQI